MMARSSPTSCTSGLLLGVCDGEEKKMMILGSTEKKPASEQQTCQPQGTQRDDIFMSEVKAFVWGEYLKTNYKSSMRTAYYFRHLSKTVSDDCFVLAMFR